MRTLVAAVVALGSAMTVLGSSRVDPPVDDAREALATDPVRALQARIDDGSVRLAYDSLKGYLPGLLETLDIRPSTQTLVFSRTSFQTDRIAPWAPRALYFNDDVYVGWVQGGSIMEVTSMDPLGGARFYSLLQQPDAPPRFQLEGDTCLLCHESRITEMIPGLIMRSTLTDRLGYPVTEFHAGSTRDQTPFDSRWGGWYVTGTHGDQTHAGNLKSPELYEDIVLPERHVGELDRSAGANLETLEDLFDVSGYLTPHSDIVALMVLAHQVRVHNLMSLVQAQGSRAWSAMVGQRQGTRYSPFSRPASGSALDRLFRSLLFVDEIELESPVRGTSAFVEEFEARGPFDGAGRSLRAFDLERRLFRYPVSYLIYTPSFDALPGFAREYVYDGLLEALTSDRLPPEFAYLSLLDRAGILEILTETKPDFAARAAVDLPSL